MKWENLQHNGILFPPDYESKGINVRIKGETISLNLAQEEMAYQWAKKKDTPYAKDKTFQKNFTRDFAKTLDKKFKSISYDDIDFSAGYRIVDKEKDARERMSKEDRKNLAAKRKKIREEIKEKYGTAIIDGKPVDMGNYMAEPPGIFIGRGAHPLRGKWKPRITKKQVTLNLGEKASVPDGEWGGIVHRHDAMWLATWIDVLTKGRKYIWLADTAGLKQDKDKEKYEKAVKLRAEIGKIKVQIIKDMKRKGEMGRAATKRDGREGKAREKNMEEADRTRRVATVCYLIYITAMRVGDEKGEDEADTVGATTLRKEHIKITPNTIEFDFLGKDSVRWKETISADGENKQFQENLKEFMEKLEPNDEIFKNITSRHVNRYYSGIVKGMTAKVFRTYQATTVVRDYLAEYEDMEGNTANEKLYRAKMANLEAAKMCNHKRTIPKTFNESLKKKRETLREIRKIQPAEKSQEALRKAKKTEPKTGAQKKKKTERIKKLKGQIKRQEQRHKDRVERLRLQLDLAEKTRDYNLGTSLRNYIDPRLVKAWTDEVGAEWEKLYTSALQKKFLWVKNEKTKWKEIK